MRRSGRSRKQREFFKPFEGIPEHESGDESSDEEGMRPPKGKLTIAKKPAAAATRVAAKPRNSLSSTAIGLSTTVGAVKKSAASKVNQFEYEGPRCRLFDVLINSGDSSSEVRSVVSMFEKNHIAAVAELINFVLLTGGAKKKWIGSRVELEGLEPEELDELLRDMVGAMTSREHAPTPLQAAANKNGITLRDRYVDIWTLFVECVNSPLTQGFNTGGGSSQRAETQPNEQAGPEILDIVSNVLVALSSSGLASVRDAVTEAALCIGQSVLTLVTVHRGKRDMAARQLKAEEQKGKSSKLTPKYKAIQKQVTGNDESIEEFTRLSLLLFNSIFAHRYKDSNEFIRANCTRRLGQWLLMDPVRMFEDTYLKYLGWMCSDRSGNVRLEAIMSISRLCEETESVGLLESFLERFIGRILEMAAQDVDERVSLAAITCLRKAQEFGALDEVDSDSISRVDGVVFDQGCSAAVRAEALRFMMEHTEGFEFLLSSNSGKVTAATSTASSSKKRRKSSSVSSPAPASNMESRRNVLLALETLTEFLDDVYRQHSAVEDPEDNVDVDEERLHTMAGLLVDAFAALPEPMSSLLCDWDGMASLLLKESEVFASGFALQDFHSTALLHLMLQSACRVDREVKSGGDIGHWAQLRNVLHDHLLRLFTRFQDSEKNLFVLASFLNYIHLSKNVKTAQAFLKSTGDFFSRCHSDALIYRITSAWSHWLSQAEAECSGGGAVGRVIEETIRGAAGSLSSTITSGRNQMNAMVVAGTRRKSKGSGDNIEDVLISISFATTKLASLMKSTACRGTVEDDLIEALVAITDMSVKAAENDGGKTAISGKVASALVGAARFVYGALLWAVKDFMNGKSGVETARRTQEVLVGIMQHCLDLGNNDALLSGDASASILPDICTLRRESFGIIGDMRVLFYPATSELHWLPSREMMESMRGVFDREVAQLQTKLAECENGSLKDRQQSEMISKTLVNTLLYPLDSVLYFDSANLNRRQGAAVLSFLADENENIVEAVKVWCKKLKEVDIIKYLEVQMVSLKSMYHDKVLAHLNRLRDADQIQSQADYTTEDIAELEELTRDGISNMHRFTQRIAQTLGVGKLKGEAASALVLFFKAGIDYTLIDALNLGFAAVLELYVRYLTPHYLTEIANYLHDAISSPSLSEDTMELLEQDPGDAPGQVWAAECSRAYNALASALSKKGGVNKSNLDISEISRDTARTGVSVRGGRSVFVKSSKNGRDSGSSRPSVESAASSVVTNGLHSHDKDYGSKRHRGNSITSNGSSIIDDIIGTSKTSFGKSFNETGVDERQNGKRPSSHTKPIKIFDDRKHVTVDAQERNAKKQKINDDRDLAGRDKGGRASGSSRRSTRSGNSSKSYTDQIYDVEEEKDGHSQEDVIAYGLHIEDPDDSEFDLRGGRKSTLSSEGTRTTGKYLGGEFSSDLFQDEATRLASGYESDDSLVIPSTRNRNR